MTDPRTQAYLRELRMRLEQQKRDMITTAGELCDCPDCMDARVRKQIPPCKQMEIMNDIQNKVLGQYPGHYAIELSPDYNPNTGRLETNRPGPVRMFEPSSNPGRIATKWTVKD